MTLHPYALVMDGRLETGLEVALDGDGAVVEVRPTVESPEDFVLSAAFVNAHSHLEYRGLQGEIKATDYADFIRSITLAKRAQDLRQVREDCLLAAAENRQTGVAYVAEHSDRPFAGEAMAASALDGVIFQEVITFNENAEPQEKLAQAAESLAANAAMFSGEVHLNPHAPWTVDEETLRTLAEGGGRVSLHVAESVAENDYFERDKGPIARASHDAGIVRNRNGRVVAYLAALGYLRKGVQFVHCCDLDHTEIEQLAGAGVAVAHCPRSNEALDCPRAPVREMLDAGVLVGLGLDSAASSGPIDMFAEMRAALEVADKRGAPLTPEEVWRMATTMGAESLGLHGWDVKPGASVPLIKLHVHGVHSTEDLVALGSPRSVEWVTPTVRN